MQLLVITSYPERSQIHSDKTVGVASYTKSLLMSMKSTQPQNTITVLAEVLSRPESYIEDDITVKRLWQRNSLQSLFSLFTTIMKRPERDLLVSFEVYMFGSPLTNLIALLGFSLLRLLGKRPTIVVHQVLGNPSQLEKNPLKAFSLTMLKTILYRLILLASTKVIVFEEQLKKQLPSSRKISVIPHLIPEPEKISKTKAREALTLNKNDFYVLYFGYLSPYKGLEELLANWQTSVDSQTHLIIAGGPNPNHKTNASYMEYVKSLKKLMSEKHIIQTGFVPEDKVPYFFAAADVLVLPYTTFMSSSGPLSLALAYELPVLLSEELSPYGNTKDIAQALKEADLNLSDITFNRKNPQSLNDHLVFSRNSYTKLTAFSRIIKKSRSKERIAERFWKELIA